MTVPIQDKLMILSEACIWHMKAWTRSPCQTACWLCIHETQFLHFYINITEVFHYASHYQRVSISSGDDCSLIHTCITTLIARFRGPTGGRPIWGRQDPGGPHVGPMKFAIWEDLIGFRKCNFSSLFIIICVKGCLVDLIIFGSLVLRFFISLFSSQLLGI